MGFSKEYFDSFEAELVAYCKRFGTNFPSVTLKLISGEEYKVATITSHTDQLLSFGFYEERKSAKLTTLPMLTVPYSGIAWVEVRPSKGEQQVGFQIGSITASKQ
jgi:hypothetical protein